MPYCVACVVHRESLGCLWLNHIEAINQSFLFNGNKNIMDIMVPSDAGGAL